MRPERLVARPETGRVFLARRRVRLADADATGRLRLDAVARYLQDVAADDVADAGWGTGADGWVVRRTRIDVLAPLREGETVELATWCSATGASAAGRRTSLAGDDGGRIETETLWIHVDAQGRPARLDDGFFALYGPSAAGRRVSTRLAPTAPPPGARRVPWPLRATDADRLGHVNNAAYWQAVEEVVDASGRLSAVLEHGRPLDLGERVVLACWGGSVAFLVGGEVRAAATVARR